MNQPPTLPLPDSAPQPCGARRRLRLVFALVGVPLLATVLVQFFVSAPEPAVAWMSPAEVKRLQKPTLFTELKYKVMRLTAPLWRPFRRNPQSVHLDLRMMTVSDAAAERIPLGSPLAKNADGLRAWILSPTELTALQDRLKRTEGVSLANAPRVQTTDGGQAQVAMIATPVIAGKPTPVGLTVNLTPKTGDGLTRLTLAMTSTEIFPLAGGNGLAVRTNFAVNCRARIPNGGGLVVSSGEARDADGNRSLFIVSPSLFDARGNPIKP